MIAALLGILATLQGAQAVPAPAIARWSLQVEPAHCVLERRDPETGSTLSIDFTPGSDSYRLAITGEGIGPSSSLKPASLTFAPSGKVTRGLARTVKLPNNTLVMLMQGLSPAFLENLSGASTMTLTVEGGIKSIVPVTDTVKAVQALQKCNADQLIEWGADPSQFAPGGLLPTALKPRDEWIQNGAFLKLASRSKRATIADDFRLLVTPDGAIAGCHATAEVTEAALEKDVCAAVVGKQLFSPARSPSGNLVIGAATFRVSLMSRPS